MKQKLKIQKGSRGITLIALVITIIVLLILAAISIATLTGDNGILTKTNEAKTETEIAGEKEQISLAYSAVMANKMKEKDDSGVTATELQGELNNLNANATATPDNNQIKVTFNKTGNVYKIYGGGKIAGPGKTITDFLSIGNYVDYDPTKADAAKTQELDEETQAKLSYTSPTGTIPIESTEIITHGNGYTSTETGGGQTFTAKPSSELKWRVLSVTEDKVELISETPVLKNDTSDNSGNFVLSGGIGYLYAEQELNAVCAIYGYGYGADTSVGASYTVGGPWDAKTGKIEGTGARSITIEDINKLAGIYEDKEDGQMKYSDGTVVNSNYGSIGNPTTGFYYPTLNSTNITNPGQSTGTKTELKNTLYSYSKNTLRNSFMRNLVFEHGQTWLANRGKSTDTTGADFRVWKASQNGPSWDILCNSTSGSWHGYKRSTNAVRPIVTLKSEVIDTSTDYETVGSWKLK